MTRRVKSRFSITGNDYLPRHSSLSSTLNAYEVNEIALSEGEVVRLFATSRETEEKWRLLHDSTYFSPSSFPNSAYPDQYLLLGDTLGAYEVTEISLTEDG